MDDATAAPETWHAPDVVATDRPSFEEFFRREMDRLLSSLVVITGNAAQAEDIAQEAFTRVYQHWDRVAAMDEPVGYLHRAAMNEFRSRYRRAVRSIGRAIRSGVDVDAFGAVDDRDEVDRILATLTPRQRAALILTEALGYSGEEAGELLGIKASTVYALTHQARTAMGNLTEERDA